MAFKQHAPVFFDAGIAVNFEELTEAEFAGAVGAAYAPPERGVFRIVAARVAQLLQDVPGNVRTSQTTAATVRLPSGLAVSNDAGAGRQFIFRNGGTGLITIHDHLGGAVGTVAAGIDVRIDHEEGDVWRLTSLAAGGGIGAGSTDQFIFGDSGTVKDAFLKSGVTQHRSNDSSYLALADGEVKAVTISTERDPDNNWFLQIVKNAVRGGSAISRSDISFSDSNPDTIVTVAGDFVADGAGLGFIPGQTIVVTSTSGLNDGTYTIVSVTPTTITLDPGDSLTTESAAAAGTVTITAGTAPFVTSGGDQVGTDLEKPGTTAGKVLDIIFTGLTGFTFKAGDRVQAFVKAGTDASGEAKEPHVVLYIQY